MTRLLSSIVGRANAGPQSIAAQTRALTVSKAIDPSAPLPDPWQMVTFGPGWPIRPIGTQYKDEVPREIDYPVSANINITPRSNYNLMPFPAMADIYETVPEVKRPVGTLARELTMFIPQLVDDDNTPVPDHDFAWILESPDGVTPWTVWLTRFIRSSLGFDAGAIHIGTDKQGYLKSFNYIDGTTLFVLVDEHGRKPQPPAPALVQIIKGQPFAWYGADEIWYRPRNPRYNSPYGESFIEQELSWVLIAANISGFALAGYREGNMPEGVGFAPPDWKLKQIDLFEEAWNSRMSAGPAERRRWRFLPNGFKFDSLKETAFPSMLYETAVDNVSMAIGVPAHERGKTPGQGLGGKGFSDVQQSTLYRMGVNPLKQYVLAPFNDLLKRAGVDDVHMILTISPESIDPDKQRKGVLDRFSSGLITLNQARSILGDDPVPGGDLFIIIAKGQPFILNPYMQAAQEGNMEALMVQQQQGNMPQGNPQQPQERDDDEQTKNLQAAEKFLKRGTLASDVFYSIPSRASQAIIAPVVKVEGKTTGNAAQPVNIAKHCGVCPDDDAYYGAPIVKDRTMAFPNSNHANDVEIVAMAPQGLEPRPAIFKPEGGENEALVERIGGPQYVRPEAAYLIDRAIGKGLYLVPVSYVAEIDDERGSVQHYVRERQPAQSIDTYDPAWVMKAGVLDYILGEPDMASRNLLTHPDDDTRPILIDVGMILPATDLPIESPFVSAIQGQVLPPGMIEDLTRLRKDAVTWRDVTDLVGASAAMRARQRLDILIEKGMVPNGQSTTVG